MHQEDIDIVSRAYDACWRRSKGPYNGWVDGRLPPLARRFYIAVNVVERSLSSGVPSLLEDPRFTLAESAAALESFGMHDHAAAIRTLAACVDDVVLPSDRREQDHKLRSIEGAEVEVARLNALFPTDEQHAYAVLAAVVRENRDVFHDPWTSSPTSQ